MVFGKNNIKNIDIILSDKCNLNCFFCSLNKWSIDTWNIKGICIVINKFFSQGFNSITFSWWEPTLDKNLLLYIAFAKKTWFQIIKLQTNLLFSENYFLKLIKSWITSLWFTYLWINKNTFFSITWNIKQFYLYNNSLNYIINYNKLINITIDIVLNKYIIDKIWEETNKLLKLWFKNINYKFPFFTWNNKLNYDLIYYSDKLKNFLLWKKFKFYILYIPTCYLEWLENHIYDFSNDYIYDFNYFFSLKESIDKIYEKFENCNDCKNKESCFWFEKINNKLFKPIKIYG